MVIFRTFNDLVVNAIERLRLVQPALDTKPGTVSRDLFVDISAEQIANFYNELRTVSLLQSFLSATGNDLARLGSNFGVQRVQGANATGVTVFTTNNLDVDILIPSGTVITARNGVSFQTTVTTLMNASSSNVFRATATRLSSDLELASITDEFAAEISVEALTNGTGGNVGRFSLISQNVPGISNITNLDTFTGGTNAESDSAFRTRILSVFAGSNTGTSLGYETAVRTDASVLDVSVVVPGDPLLIRDGTVTATDTDGNLIVSEPGTGGKVDIYILGSRLESAIDSFIFNDQSGTGDVTDPVNDTILGQQGEDPTVNISQRRVTLIASGNLPLQPVDSVISVSGSSSGGNFLESFTDDQGRLKGNYELLKDTGDFAGSSFGFDKLHFTSAEIELDDEDVTKGIFNGTDALDFSDVLSIRDITQGVLVTNENSTTNTTDRSSIQLKHSPTETVSRVINLTTGERYTVTSQNPDGVVGDINITGRITISGSTLPVGTDVLQVDYTWVKPYDNLLDYDNLAIVNTFRTVQDSVDWGFANLVANEPSTIEDAYGSLTVEVTHPVSKVIEVNKFVTESTTVSNGTITLSTIVSNLIDVRRVSDSAELFNTDLANGSLSGTATVVLPTDSLAIDGDTVTVRFNTDDQFAVDGYEDGTFSSNVITLSEGAVFDSGDTGVLVVYVADVKTLVESTDLTSLPITQTGNSFLIDSDTSGEQPTSNLLSGTTKIQNLRRAASHIRVTTSAIGSSGVLGVSGTTSVKLVDALVTVTSGNGYDVNLSSAILTDLGLTAVPSSVKVSRLSSFERVNVNTNTNIVSSVDNVYDITNYTINDNTFDLNVALVDTSLNSTSISLPVTTDNTAALLVTGDVVRVTFYYVNTDDSQQLFFSRNGVQITDKIFEEVSRISVSSGFLNPAGVLTGEILVENFNQPIDNTAYDSDYNYTAPKENERITVTFNNNDVITDTTFLIEGVRPITADVLIKEAEAKDIDVTINIVLLPEFSDSSQTVQQDSVDSVTAFLNASSLGTIVDASDVINNLYSVSGIDRVTMINFSTGTSGNVASITAESNQYLRAGDITIAVEER